MRATTSLPLLLLLPVLALTVHSDESEYPTDYFRSPLGIPIMLSGNFAEMRDGHFHGGLDIKTRESEGYRVYAAADGYIERVKVSPFGYGNALYVAHPNGYTTVYAHLSRLKGDIAGFVRSTQYDRRTFAIDEYLEAGRFPVRKGQIIALSGNSGSSSGPHLHFEIRTTRDQVPVNPLLFGFDVDDSQTPRIYRIKVYPVDEHSGVITAPDQTGRPPGDPVTLEVESTDSGYRLATGTPIHVWGRIAFGIQTHDYHDGSRSRLGAFRIRLTIGGTEIFGSTMERISFADTRYIHAHVDYAERKTNRRWIQRSYRLPGNQLPIYRLENDGIVSVTAGDTLEARYVVEDASGNVSTLSFPVVGVDAPPTVPHERPEVAVHTIRYDAPFVISRENFEVEMPPNALYEDTEVTYREAAAPAGAYSSLHEFHNDLTPVHRRYRLSIRPVLLPEHLREKALIARLDDDGDVLSAGGDYSTGFVTARPRSFGRYFVVVDTTAPTIESLDVRPGDKIGRRSRLRFRIKDDLAGIASYDGFVDGQWSLFVYDAKRNMLVYDVDPTLAAGQHLLRVRTTDGKDNVSEIEIPFTK